MNTNSKNNIPSQNKVKAQLFNNTLSSESQERVSMTTIQISEATGKMHKHVLVDTEKMFNDLEIRSDEFSADYKDGQNRKQKMYILPEMLILTLTTGYSIKLRFQIVQELQQLKKLKKPESKKDWILLALCQEEENEQLRNQLAIQAPAIELVRDIIESNGLFTIKQVAEQLKIGSNLFFAYLRDNKYLHSKGDNYNMPYSEFVTDKKYFEVKVSNKYWIRKSKNIFGIESVEKIYYSTVYITARGIDAIKKRIDNQDSNELL